MIRHILRLETDAWRNLSRLKNIVAVEFGRLYKHNGEWKFEAVGKGFKGGLQYFVNKYVR